MDSKKLSLLLKNKKTQNFFIYGLGQAFNLISPLAVIPYIVAVCGEAGLGKQALGFNLALFLILIVDYAFDVKGTKEAAEKRDDKEQLEKLLNTTIFTKGVLFIGVTVIFLALVYTVPFFSGEKLLFILSLSMVLGQVFIPVWFLQGTEHYTAASIINICSKGLYLILVYSFISTKEDYIYVNLFLGGCALVFNIAGLAFIIRKYSFRISPPRFSEIITLLKADFSFCVSQLFLSLRQLSPIYIITGFLGYGAAGQYRILEQVIATSRTFIQVFLRYFFPIACYKVAENAKAGFRFWKRYSGYGLLVVTAAMAVMATMPEQVLHFFNDSAKSVNEMKAPFLLMLFVPVVMAASTALEQLMFIIGRNSIYIKIVIAVTIITMGLLFAVLDRFGIMGVVATFILAELLLIGLYFKNSYLHLSHKTN